jgi:membrane protease YdiL (CAAX protease family)
MSVFLTDDARLRVGWRFAFSVIAVVFADVAAGNIAVLLTGNHHRAGNILYLFLAVFLLLGCFVFLTRTLDQPTISALAYIGLPRRHWLRETLSGALLGFVLIFLAVMITAVFFHYHITRIVLNPHTVSYPPLVTLALLAGAMAEELMFRGYPFQRLVEGLGKVGAIIVLSALFGAVHLHNPHVSDNRTVEVFAFCNTVLIGIVFAIAYLRTRALWFPWGLHFAWNITMGVIFGIPVSGIADFSVLVKSRVGGPAWFLGGSYGFEGGLVGTIVIVLGLVYVVIFVRPVPAQAAPPPLNERAGSGIQPTGNL